MTAAAHDTDAAALVALYAHRVELTKVAASETTGGTLDAVLAAGRALDVACEEFRRRYYPRARRVAVGLYAVFAQSRTGRGRTVLDLFDQYRDHSRTLDGSLSVLGEMGSH